MNHWLTVVPNTENSTVLGRDEFWDIVLLQYKLIPKDLLEYCNRCGEKHSLQYALQCKIGGLIGARHDNYRDKLGSVASQVFSPSAICDNPIISKCWDSKKKGRN
eukprot:2151276-Ditylum_brightwellii.AAC.1